MNDSGSDTAHVVCAKGSLLGGLTIRGIMAAMVNPSAPGPHHPH